METEVFLPHPTECWAVAKLTGPNTYTLVDPVDVTTESKDYSLTSEVWTELQKQPHFRHLPPFEHHAKCIHAVQDPLDGADNLAALIDNNDGCILHAICARYKSNRIYTNVGSIVIALNPFESRPDLYSPAVVESFARSPNPLMMTPHIYQIAAAAFQSLSGSKFSTESILITGESGSGKTESTKLLLRFLANDSRSAPQATPHASIEEKILSANPILEAFGNSTTARNPNSSRFGKWIVLGYDSALHLASSCITSYILELSRVCSHPPTDRNYHIFYQLRDSGYEGFMSSTTSYGYLTPQSLDPSETTVLHHLSVDDKQMFSDLLLALDRFEFTKNEQHSLFSVVGAIAHMGNIQFDPDPKTNAEACVVRSASQADFSRTSSLLGIDPQILSQAFLTRDIRVGRDTVQKKLNVDKACQARDSLAKLIYGTLFKWLIHRINESLDAENTTKGKQLGLLDFAGFECFKHNSLEQLHINLSNERLQLLFNKTVIASELEEYAAEGLMDVSVDYSNNEPIIDLISGRAGLMALLDEELVVPQGSDEGFYNKCLRSQGNHPAFIKPKVAKDLSFGIKHFAGTVSYSVNGWLLKNRFEQPAENLKAMQIAHNNVMKQMAQLLDVADNKKQTIGTTFKKQLDELNDMIANSNTNFIRCIKPNQSHTPRAVEAAQLYAQLHTSGIIEAIRIRKSGFSFRVPYTVFSSVYSILLESKVSDPRDATKAILSQLTVSKTDVFWGKTKIMLKESVRATLDQKKEAFLASYREPLNFFIERYTVACSKQKGMFLWPEAILGPDINTCPKLQQKLNELTTLVKTIEEKFNFGDEVPVWISTSKLIADGIAQELKFVNEGTQYLDHVNATKVDRQFQSTIKAFIKTSEEANVHNEVIEKLKKLLKLMDEEFDWVVELNSEDADVPQLLEQAVLKRELITKECTEAVKAAQTRIAEKQKKESLLRAQLSTKKSDTQMQQAAAPISPKSPPGPPPPPSTKISTMLDITAPTPPPTSTSVRANLAKSIPKRAAFKPKAAHYPQHNKCKSYVPIKPRPMVEPVSEVASNI